MDCKNAIEDNTDDNRDTLKQADTCESLACKNNFQIKFASLPHAIIWINEKQLVHELFIRLMKTTHKRKIKYTENAVKNERNLIKHQDTFRKVKVFINVYLCSLKN